MRTRIKGKEGEEEKKKKKREGKKKKKKEKKKKKKEVERLAISTALGSTIKPI